MGSHRRILNRAGVFSDSLFAEEIHGVPKCWTDKKGEGEILGAHGGVRVATWIGERHGLGGGHGRIEAQEVR